MFVDDTIETRDQIGIRGLENPAIMLVLLKEQ
jgi:hypothetical protein